ncbi:nitrile hydratase subunit beta [Pseudomonadales bacterium]|jgi:nitrile hydratase|nr:nitrile hydratase subunit beta [Pseudomonadales bacterium]MDA8879873.1 nitrile hydratase subunit beta [Pseudomonadales bacterium]MDC1018650.1 nitrile hydratase subunit beta [Pseudomonadales bacterium]
MDGIHDLGGKQGHGKVDKGQPSARNFPERWQAAVFTMSNVGPKCGAWTNTDTFRHGVERISPTAYLTHGYYGRWLGGIETLLVEAGVVSQKEITTRALAIGARKSDLIAAQPNKQLATPIKQPTAQGAQRSLNHAPKFVIHAQIRTTHQSIPGHTRLPAYARGKTGTVIKHHGVWVFPDSNAHGEGEQPQHLYTIAFRATDLWDDGEHGVQVSLDLFESYLHASDYSNDMCQQ